MSVKSALGIGIAAAAVTSAAVAGAASGHVRQRVVSTITSLTPFGLGGNSDSHTEFGDVSGVGITRTDEGGRTADSTRPDDTRPRVDGQSVAGTSPNNGIDVAHDTPASDAAPASVPPTDPSVSTSSTSTSSTDSSTSTSSSSSSTDTPAGISVASGQPGGSNVPTSVPQGRP